MQNGTGAPVDREGGPGRVWSGVPWRWPKPRRCANSRMPNVAIEREPPSAVGGSLIAK